MQRDGVRLQRDLDGAREALRRRAAAEQRDKRPPGRGERQRRDHQRHRAVERGERLQKAPRAQSGGEDGADRDRRRDDERRRTIERHHRRGEGEAHNHTQARIDVRQDGASARLVDLGLEDAVALERQVVCERLSRERLGGRRLAHVARFSAASRAAGRAGERRQLKKP